MDGTVQPLVDELEEVKSALRRERELRSRDKADYEQQLQQLQADHAAALKSQRRDIARLSSELAALRKENDMRKALIEKLLHGGDEADEGKAESDEGWDDWGEEEEEGEGDEVPPEDDAPGEDVGVEQEGEPGTAPPKAPAPEEVAAREAAFRVLMEEADKVVDELQSTPCVVKGAGHNDESERNAEDTHLLPAGTHTLRMFVSRPDSVPTQHQAAVPDTLSKITAPPGMRPCPVCAAELHPWDTSCTCGLTIDPTTDP
eukprot:Sspe_Gene.99731::Locus_73528_Transcript_1_1_Confidence_1.000_Length_1079::g.99731::m.99731